MKDFSPIFRALGFTESEVQTYLAGLELGPSTVIDITKKTNLSRQATYEAIKSLAERGLMSSVEQDKKTHYVAERPQKLLAYAKRYEQTIQERIKELKDTVTDLELLSGGEKPVVRLFEGKEGAKFLLSELIDSKAKEVWEIADLNAVRALFSEEEHKPFIEKTKKSDIRYNALYAGSSKGNEVEANRFFLPIELGGFKSNIFTYKNKIGLVTFSGKIHSILVESEDLAKALRILFSYALKGAEKEHLKQD